MEDLSVSFIFGQAWELTKKHLLRLVLATFLIYALGGAISTWMMIPPGGSFADIATSKDPNYGANIISTIIGIVFSVGVYTGILRICRGEGTLDFSCFSRPLSVYLKYFCVDLLFAIIVGVGLVLLIVPGIYFAARLCLAPIYAIDNPEVGIIDALKRSWAATEGHVLELIGLGIIAFFVGILGVLACCVGIFVAIPVGWIATVLIYLVLTSQMQIVKAEENTEE